MTTIINTPLGEKNDSSAFGVILTILVFILLAALLIFYGLPQLRSTETIKQDSTEIKVTVPERAPITPPAAGQR